MNMNNGFNLDLLPGKNITPKIHNAKKASSQYFYTAVKTNLSFAWSEMEELPSGQRVVYISDGFHSES